MNGNEHGLHLDDKSRGSTSREPDVRRAALKDAGLLPEHGVGADFNSTPLQLPAVASYNGRLSPQPIRMR
jgi:hypothetical protein